MLVLLKIVGNSCQCTKKAVKRQQEQGLKLSQGKTGNLRGQTGYGHGEC